MLHLEVAAARKALDMSQRDLADLAGVPRSQLSSFEKRGTNITLDSLRKLVAVLPNIKELSLGVRDVKVVAGSADATRAALAELRRAADKVAALVEGQAAEPVGATELRRGGTAVAPALERKLVRASTRAKSAGRRRVIK